MNKIKAKFKSTANLTGFGTSPASHVLPLPGLLKPVKVIQALGAIAIIGLSVFGLVVVYGLQELFIGFIISIAAVRSLSAYLEPY